MTGNELALVVGVTAAITVVPWIAVALLQRLPKMRITVSDAEIAAAVAAAMRRMTEQLNDLNATLGAALLPAMRAVSQAMHDLARAWSTPAEDGEQ
jgi:hypothetical protein